MPKNKKPIVEESSEEEDSQMLSELEQIDEEGEMEMMEEEGENEMHQGELAGEEEDEEEAEGDDEDSDAEENEEFDEDGRAEGLEVNVDEGLETNIKSKRDDVINEMLLKEDLGVIQMRMKDTLKVLSNFKTLRDGAKTREDYMQELKQDVQNAYDYNSGLLDVLFNLFSP